MNTDKLNNWLQIIASIGILIGLLLVGFEMRQNSELLRAELEFAESQRNIDFAKELIGNDTPAIFAKHLTQLEQLTFEEQVSIDAFYFMYFENWGSMYNQALIGPIEEITWRNRVAQDAVWLLNNPYGRARWATGQIDLPAEVVELVNDALEGDPLGRSSSLPYYQSLFDNALKNAANVQN